MFVDIMRQQSSSGNQVAQPNYTNCNEDTILQELMEEQLSVEKGWRHHTPPTLTPSSYGNVLEKRARQNPGSQQRGGPQGFSSRGNDPNVSIFNFGSPNSMKNTSSNQIVNSLRPAEERQQHHQATVMVVPPPLANQNRRLRSASDLEEHGLLTSEERLVLKDKIVGGDVRLSQAIDKYDAGDSTALEKAIQEGLLQANFSSRTRAGVAETHHPKNNGQQEQSQQQQDPTPSINNAHQPQNHGRLRTASIDLLAELEIDDDDLSSGVLSKPPPTADVLGLPHDDQLMGFDMELPFFYSNTSHQASPANNTLINGKPNTNQASAINNHSAAGHHVSSGFISDTINHQRPSASQQHFNHHNTNGIQSTQMTAPTVVAGNTVVTTTVSNTTTVQTNDLGVVSVIATNDPPQRNRQHSNNKRTMSISSYEGMSLTTDDFLYRRTSSTDQQIPHRFIPEYIDDVASVGSTSSAHRSDYPADGVHRFGGKTAPGLRGSGRTSKISSRYGDRSRHRPSPSGVASSLNTALNHIQGVDALCPAVAYDGPVSSTVTIPPDAATLNPGPAPAYEALVNFPRAKTRAQIHCVMCGRIPRECAAGLARQAALYDQDKGNKSGAPRPDGLVVIPRQNKDVCRDCDKALWRHLESDTHFKWCKGCKRFRNLVAFAEKLAASKCDRCRERGRQGYQRRKGGTGSPPGTPVHALEDDP